ncbi:hypothetical protein D1872_207310 [compost metagenome]
MGHDDVRRHQAAVEQHGEEREKGEKIAEFKAFARDRVSVKSDEQQADHRPHHRDEDRHAVGTKQGVPRLKHITVSFQTPLGRNQLIAVARQHALVGEGNNDDEQKRKHAEKGENTGKKVEHHIPWRR